MNEMLSQPCPSIYPVPHTKVSMYALRNSIWCRRVSGHKPYDQVENLLRTELLKPLRSGLSTSPRP